MNKGYIVAIIGAGILGAVISGAYSDYGHKKQMVLQQDLIIKQQAKIKDLEIKHSKREHEIINSFNEAKKQYENTITNINSDHADSLRRHEERSNSYRQEYQQCSKLVGRAVQLDRAVTEGVGLVEELEAFIRLEEFINDLNQDVIKNDRDLINSR